MALAFNLISKFLWFNNSVFNNKKTKPLELKIDEMYKVYNCGIGFVMIIDDETFAKIDKHKFTFLGKIE